MENIKQQRISLVTLIMSGMLFLVGGLDYLDQGKLAFGTFQALAGLANLILAFFKRRDSAKKLDQIALIFNLLTCILIAIDYFREGKQFLPYAYLLASLFSFLALMINRLRN